MNDFVHADDFLYERPFGAAGPIFYHNYFRAIALLREHDQSEWDSERLIAQVNGLFSEEYSKLSNKYDPHLNDGLFDRLRVRKRLAASADTRVSLLVKRHCARSLAFEQDTNRRRGRDQSERSILSSPLAFLQQVLTDPKYPSSAAYAHALVRAMIFGAAANAGARLARSRASPSVSARAAVWGWIDSEKIVSALRDIEAHFERGDAINPSSPTEFILLHMLAAKGYFHLSLARGSEVIEPSKHRGFEHRVVGLDTLLERRSLVPPEDLYEFVASKSLKSLPSPAEIANEIDGLPIPVPGLDAVFAGGIRFTINDGAMGRVAGRSGAGKTSFAIGLATALAPLGITTVYLSCEENKEDLKHRIQTMVPEFVRRTATFPQRIDDWLIAYHLGHPNPAENQATIVHIVDALLDEYGQKLPLDDLSERRVIDRNNSRPGLVPLLLVIDGAHELLTSWNDTILPEEDMASEVTIGMHGLVEKLRQLGAFTLMLSARDDRGSMSALDYLVDFLVNLHIEHVGSVTEPPLRTFVLEKTRRQHACQGAHILSLSPRQLMAVAPQLSTQRDRLRDFLWSAPRGDRWFDVLRRAEARGKTARHSPKLVDYAAIKEQTQTLVMGHGSGGKAGFALRILCSPLVEEHHEATELAQRQLMLPVPATKTLGADRRSAVKTKNIRRTYGSKGTQQSRRILVISFLFDDDYYDNLVRRIVEGWQPKRSSEQEVMVRADARTQLPPPRILLDTLRFYPGHLRPEEFLRDISGKLRGAELEGLPFDAVLIDGLHNVPLQFPHLQGSSIFWPILFEILRKQDVSVVTTFTHFDLGEGVTARGLAADLEAANRRIAPLLHALVGSADNIIDVSEVPDRRDHVRIHVKTARDWEVDERMWFWDRQKCVAYVE